MSDDYEKFFHIEHDKQERIINAAMKEFLIGYKKASTDNIVREAGISKGLLFHYFGTKEKLYEFLIDYCIDIMKKEFLDLINVEQTDILESFWQLSLLKRDLCHAYPTIFDFMGAVYVDETTNATGIRDTINKFMKTRDSVVAQVYTHADTSLFRDDVNPKAAIEIIGYVMQGYAQTKFAEVPSENVGSTARENYDMYLSEFEGILNTLRLVFYK
jgi:AcrR family transcriptional regulator